MNEKNYTSLKLSKLLAEKGCKLKSKYSYIFIERMNVDTKNGEWADWRLGKTIKNPTENCGEQIPTYDLLWDVCVKYAKEFFGMKCGKCNTILEIWNIKNKDGNKEWINKSLTCPKCLEAPPSEIAYKNHIQKIFILLQQNKKQEAEDFIWENCKFNFKNK